MDKLHPETSNMQVTKLASDIRDANE